jgi:pimeloyl-ACP methyl ester carboxylesterase
MNYSEMAQDLLAFLDAHDIPKAVLVGHSMGGKVAQAVALMEPSRVDGLVVLDIAPVAYSNDEPHWKAVQDIVTVLAKLPVGPGVTRRDVDVQLRSAIPDPALRAFCLTNFDANKGQWKIHIQAICAQLDEIASFDISSPLLNNGKSSSSSINGEEMEMEQQQQYPGDAFFIHGGQSRFVRHAYIPAIQSYFPNHMLTTVRGAGHWIHAEKPEDTIALLKRFLER